MISFGLLKGFLRKELKQTLRDPRMRILLFVAPIIQLVLFGVALSNEVKNIRLYVNYAPTDTVLQHIYEHAIQSKWFLPVPDTTTDPYELLQAGKIDAALIPPPLGLTETIGRGVGEIQLLIDGSNVLQSQSVESYLKQIIEKVVQNDLKIDKIEFPIQFIIKVLFNPTLETAYFMVPGVVCLLLCIITIILTSASITREKEMGTFEMLISAPVSAKEVILGKTIPYVILGLCDAPLILGVAVFVFGVPFRGSLLVLSLVTLTFICTTVAIGTLISTFAKNQQQSILGGFLFLFPAILLSGLLFPVENMPDFLKWLSFLDPLSHYLSLLRNIMLKGGETDFILKHTMILFAMASVLIFISYKRFHTTLE